MVLSATTPTPDELDELAALTGYEAEPTSGKLPAPRATPEAAVPLPNTTEGDVPDDDVVEAMPLLDEEDLQEDTTPPKAWNNPWIKLGGVALVLGAIALVVGFGVMGFQSEWSDSQKPEVATSEEPIEGEMPEVDPSQSEVGDLKTKEALSRQATALDQTNDDVIATAPIPATVATPNAPTASAPTVSSAPVATARPPIQYAGLPPVSRSVSQPSAPVSAPASYSQPSTASTAQALDPMEQWLAASSLGSYGQVSYASTVPVSQPAVAQTAVVPAVATTVEDGTGIVELAAAYEQSLYDADAAAILSGTPSSITQITAGTMAIATLRTPIVWDQDLDSEQQPQRFGLQLTQPLLAADGSEALPVGTQMVAQVVTVSDSGLVELSVQAVIEPTARGNQLVVVPPGAIFVFGESGNPIMAQNYHHNRGRIRGLNAQIALMGALGKVGELLNRPSSATTTSTPYISSTSVNNDDTNIIGGLLEGGFNSLEQQVSQQNQQEIQGILSRPSVWYVPAGDDLQIFVNSSFQVAS